MLVEEDLIIEDNPILTYIYDENKIMVTFPLDLSGIYTLDLILVSLRKFIGDPYKNLFNLQVDYLIRVMNKYYKKGYQKSDVYHNSELSFFNHETIKELKCPICRSGGGGFMADYINHGLGYHDGSEKYSRHLTYGQIFDIMVKGLEELKWSTFH